MQNRPVVIGVGCISQKDAFDNLDEALILMEKAMQLAISDSTNNDIKATKATVAKAAAMSSKITAIANNKYDLSLQKTAA